MLSGESNRRNSHIGFCVLFQAGKLLDGYLPGFNFHLKSVRHLH